MMVKPKGMCSDVSCNIQYQPSFEILSSKAIYCGSLCTANANCQAYYYESPNCYEAAASGLVGTVPDSPTARAVFMDSSINSGRHDLGKILHYLLGSLVGPLKMLWSHGTCSFGKANKAPDC